MSESLDIEYQFEDSKRVKNIPRKLLVGGGPPNCSPRVLAALSQPPLSVTCKEIHEMMDELKEMLRYVFQTKNRMTFAIQSSGFGTVEAACINLLKPGEKVLVPVVGHLAVRMAELARRIHLQVIEVTAPVGEVFTLQNLENEIIKHKPDLLLIVHGESGMGIFQPLEGIGDICQRHNCLFVVDAVASLGCVPFFTDRWKIDVAIATSNKGMRGPAGVGFLTFSTKAFERVMNREAPSFYFYLARIAKVWNCFDEKLIYHYTFDAHYLFAAKEAISEIIEEGLVNTWNRHKINCEKLHREMKSIGMESFIKNSNIHLPLMNLFCFPKEINIDDFIEFVEENYQVKFSTGLGFGIYADARKSLRIGLMGYNSRTEVVERIKSVLKEALENYSAKKII